MTGPGRAPALIKTTGMATELVAALYDAADTFFLAAPWKRIPEHAILKVECDPWDSGPWYATVQGQTGTQFGLVLYEDLELAEGLAAGRLSAEEAARQISSLAVTFSQMYELAPDDVDAVELHDWPVAGSLAWPNVVRVNPGMSRRAALPWEVELLVACLRTIPQVLTRKGLDSGWKQVETAGREVGIRVSRMARGES